MDDRTPLTGEFVKDLYYVHGQRIQVGPGFILDVLVLSDELPPIGDSEEYPTGDFYTYVAMSEQWVYLADDDQEFVDEEADRILEDFATQKFGVA